MKDRDAPELANHRYARTPLTAATTTMTLSRREALGSRAARTIASGRGQYPQRRARKAQGRAGRDHQYCRDRPPRRKARSQNREQDAGDRPQKAARRVPPGRLEHERRLSRQGHCDQRGRPRAGLAPKPDIRTAPAPAPTKHRRRRESQGREPHIMTNNSHVTHETS